MENCNRPQPEESVTNRDFARLLSEFKSTSLPLHKCDRYAHVRYPRVLFSGSSYGIFTCVSC